MCSQDVLVCLVVTPLVVVPDGIVASSLMHVFDSLHVVSLVAQFCSTSRVFEEECVVGITGGVLLRLEESVEVPEAGLNESVCGHFLETHGCEVLLEE